MESRSVSETGEQRGHLFEIGNGKAIYISFSTPSSSSSSFSSSTNDTLCYNDSMNRVATKFLLAIYIKVTCVKFDPKISRN